MTVEEYYRWFAQYGFKPTGEGTDLMIEFSDGHTHLMVTRPDDLSPAQRDAAIERQKLYLGIGKPPGGGGVH